MLDEADERRLDGLHVLVAEDDHIQCDGIVACITDFGATVVGPAHNLSEAHQLVTSNSIDIAVVDIDLGDGDTFDLARVLQSKGLPSFLRPDIIAARYRPILGTSGAWKSPLPKTHWSARSSTPLAELDTNCRCMTAGCRQGQIGSPTFS